MTTQNLELNRQEYFWIYLISWGWGYGLAKNESYWLLALLISISIYFMSLRIKSIGLSKKWMLASIVPVLNVYLSYCLLFIPNGYFIKGHYNYKSSDKYMGIGQILFAILFLFCKKC